jgi:hypothetical protein
MEDICSVSVTPDMRAPFRRQAERRVIACAESAGAEVFLTTDDGLRLRALREANKLSVHVENPAKWYAEVITP